MSGSIRVRAVLVSFNSVDLTLRAVMALQRFSRPGLLDVVVVDNASGDDTVARLRAEVPEVTVIESGENRGFGAANNLGMSELVGDLPAADFFLLINTDAFVSAGTVDALVRRMAAEPGLGVCGPKLRNQDGTLQRSCFGFPTPRLAWLENLGLGRWAPGNRVSHEAPARVDFVSGACMLVRRTAYEATGGFDEDFFMYSEETDWQRRMTDSGWGIGFEPRAEVTHLGGGSQSPGSVNPEFFRSLDRYQRKHHGAFGMWSFRAAMAVGAGLRLPVRWVLAAHSEAHRAKLRVNRFVLVRLLWGEASPWAAMARHARAVRRAS